MRWVLGILLCCAATALLAHAGVRNADVMARMGQMTELDRAFKDLSKMANGRLTYDAAAAQIAREALIGGAARTVTLFEIRATDPKMEALPILWDQFGDFTVKAMDMGAAAAAISLPPTPAELRAVGATCRACHQHYTAD